MPEEELPAETPLPVDRSDVTNLDEDHLRRYIMSGFMGMIADKQDYGWVSKKEYARKAYYGKKDTAMLNWPWPGASAFPVPMTPTLLDTAWANVQSGIFSHSGGPCRVNGTQDEDIRPAKIQEHWMNWQLMNDMDFEHESSKNVLRTFLDGTGIMKTMFDIRTGRVRVASLELENFFTHIDATGLQKDGTDMIIQIIPLTYNDIQMRKAMGVYRDVDSIIPGIGAVLRNQDQIRLVVDQISGVSKDQKVRRDNYYMAEVHVAYVPPGSGRVRDLIVWMSPNGGFIQRIREVKGRRPFADAHAYHYDDDRFYSMGLPEKVQPEQEKLDYSDKQYTDAMDVAIRPAAFVDDTDNFDRTRQQRVPGGIYPKGNGSKVDWEPQPPVERGFAQERALVWEMAERKTGIIDITQGRPSAFGGKTLGEVEIRTARADVRFSAIFKRFERQYREVYRQIYELNHEYTSEQKIMDVIGYSSEGYTMNEIFPVKDGRLVNYNFGFSGALQSDREAENLAKVEYYTAMLADPANDPATVWRIKKELAIAKGVEGVESIIPKPKEANIMSSNEFIGRVVSGQKDLQIRPGIDADDYVFELQLFKRTQTYMNLEPYQKQLIEDGLRRAFMMSVAERKAQLDMRMVLEKARFGEMQDQAMAMQ